MSSFDEGSHAGGENEDIEADVSTRNEDGRPKHDSEDEIETSVAGGAEHEEDALIEDAPFDDNRNGEEDVREDEAQADEQRVLEEDFPQLAREHTGTPEPFLPDEGPSTPVLRSRDASPAESASIPDDTPSLQGSLLSSPGRVASPGSRKPLGRKGSAALQPFERRFEARPLASRSSSATAGSPGFLSPHSRQVSLSSQISQISSQGESADTETPQAPWDVVRWTKLRKITAQAFSEAGRRNFGRPTCLAVSALIAIGTSKGLVLGFDYHQTLKIIIGQNTKATECGSVTALAIAADYSTIASGHANGHIFTWEINRPAQPFLRIPSLDRSLLQNDKHPDGHISNNAILHIGFLGTRHTALVSADAAGMAFSHLATRGLGPVSTLR